MTHPTLTSVSLNPYTKHTYCTLTDPFSRLRTRKHLVPRRTPRRPHLRLPPDYSPHLHTYARLVKIQTLRLSLQVVRIPTDGVND